MEILEQEEITGVIFCQTIIARVRNSGLMNCLFVDTLPLLASAA